MLLHGVFDYRKHIIEREMRGTIYKVHGIVKCKIKEAASHTTVL
jgi:hypothetical protein